MRTSHLLNSLGHVVLVVIEEKIDTMVLSSACRYAYIGLFTK